jgi:hypothetical protein
MRDWGQEGGGECEVHKGREGRGEGGRGRLTEGKRERNRE